MTSRQLTLIRFDLYAERALLYAERAWIFFQLAWYASEVKRIDRLIAKYERP
jgi:hypothetical protein